MKRAILLVSRKIDWFYPEILPLSNHEEEWLLLTYYLCTCLSWIFVSTRCALTWVTNILVRPISNVHAGRIWPTADLVFPTPGAGPGRFWEQVSWNYTKTTEWLLTQGPVVLVHISVLEGSVHDAQCVATTQLQQDSSVIISFTITMPANHTLPLPSIVPNVCIEVSQKDRRYVITRHN